MMQLAVFLLVALRIFSTILAAPIRSDPAQAALTKRSSSYWVANIQRQGSVAYGDSGFQIYRNVMDFGAVGDGVTDDTAAINSAISSGNRCGQGCDSSTTTPAIIYFPPGTYLVSSPIVQYYYTQFIGDAVTLPTLKASSSFSGSAVIDSDPYLAGGANWYTNQNNFYRQIRNFVIDITAMGNSGSCIHWQVAQATSLQNIIFNMNAGTDSQQVGINMDNGSANFLSDLIFNGGKYGAFFGNQQFTTRNLTFNNCQTAIYMNWNWVWTLKSITVNNCGLALDISAGGSSGQGVGSAILQDSNINNTPMGVLTAFTADSSPNTAGTFILDNVDFSNCATAIQSTSGATLLGGNTVVQSWGQGRQYTGSNGNRIQQTLSAPSKPGGLLNGNGAFFERSKPQYEGYPASSFVSIKSAGAKGDGVTDDTVAIQNAINALGADQILYFDHGAYVVSSTINVPGNSNIKITGEIWPMIMASGSVFQDQNNPTPVFKIGNPGDVGTVELSDLVFQTIGPQAGAILLQWNIVGASQGAAAMWDVHFRIGGSAGTQLQSNTCTKDPSDTSGPNDACIGAFLLLHITGSASVYVENAWMWNSDHELDLADHNQINIFTGRGVLIESTQPTWLYGTSSEHSVLYQYNILNAANVYLGAIQTETPYYQSNPDATVPFTSNSAYGDPTFSNCAADDEGCKKAWGLMVSNSNSVFVYGAGLYSFYDNYDQSCLDTESCQENMVSVSGSNGIHFYAMSTKASVNMITADGVTQATDADNRDTFCATVALWED